VPRLAARPRRARGLRAGDAWEARLSSDCCAFPPAAACGLGLRAAPRRERLSAGEAERGGLPEIPPSLLENFSAVTPMSPWLVGSYYYYSRPTPPTAYPPASHAVAVIEPVRGREGEVQHAAVCAAVCSHASPATCCSLLRLAAGSRLTAGCADPPPGCRRELGLAGTGLRAGFTRRRARRPPCTALSASQGHPEGLLRRPGAQAACECSLGSSPPVAPALLLRLEVLLWEGWFLASLATSRRVPLQTLRPSPPARRATATMAASSTASSRALCCRVRA